MKKIQTMFLVAFLALAFAMGSCKKDEPAVSSEIKNENVAVKALLTKKWYYVLYENKFTPDGKFATSTNKFQSQFIQFNTNNTLADNFYFNRAGGTFVLSADGKTAELKFPVDGTKPAITIKINITVLTATDFNLSFTDGDRTITLTLSVNDPRA